MSRAETAELRVELASLVNKVPLTTFQSWSVDRVRAFKACVDRAARLLRDERSSAAKLAAALAELRSFHRF